MTVSTRKFEGEFASPLAEVQKEHPNVVIGSYPKMGEGYVLISVEGMDEKEVREVVEKIARVVDGYDIVTNVP
jgi:molybdopterin-biosynthesis enzyme MoeA-like protein